MASIKDLIIPTTQARLASTIKLRMSIDGDASAALVDLIDPRLRPALGGIQGIQQITQAQQGVGTVGALLNSLPMKDIGSVTSFSRDQSREVEARYSLGRDSFEPFQIVPLKIKTELTLKHVLLYRMPEVQKLFAFFPENLMFQQFPFIIQQEWVRRIGQSHQAEVVGVNIYTDCWFLTNPITYDIMAQDQIIIQESKVRCGKVITTDESEVSKRNMAIEGAGAIVEGLVNSMSLLSELGGLTKGGNVAGYNVNEVMKNPVKGLEAGIPKSINPAT